MGGRGRGGGGGGGGGAGGAGGGGWVKDLSTVLCFVSLSLIIGRYRADKQRCNQTGHFANNCPNQAVPGDRGGLLKRRREDEE